MKIISQSEFKGLLHNAIPCGSSPSQIMGYEVEMEKCYLLPDNSIIEQVCKWYWLTEYRNWTAEEVHEIRWGKAGEAYTDPELGFSFHQRNALKNSK